MAAEATKNACNQAVNHPATHRSRRLSAFPSFTEIDKMLPESHSASCKMAAAFWPFFF
jgi:hypothetical protein